MVTYSLLESDSRQCSILKVMDLLQTPLCMLYKGNISSRIPRNYEFLGNIGEMFSEYW